MVALPAEICRDFSQAVEQEWLVTNGLGGYASGTVAGANSRRYHGLLVAALTPPVGRTVLLAKVEEELQVGAATYLLSSNEYEDGTVFPTGFQHLTEFRLELGLPVFSYEMPGAALTKRVWMDYGSNTTHIKYTLASGSSSTMLRLTPLVTYRDFHHHTRGALDWRIATHDVPGGVEVRAYDGAHPFRLLAPRAVAVMGAGWWYWRFLHRREQERGLDAVEDLYAPVQFAVRLEAGDAITLTATTDAQHTAPHDPTRCQEREAARRRALLTRADLPPEDSFARQLTLAADAFLVTRPLPEHQHGRTVVAGYHWFGDWGRDTMIALPGLALCTGRAEEARAALLAFARYVDQGMLPNLFPESDQSPEYNTVDATLWYFQTLARYVEATGDVDLLRELFPTLEEVLRAHAQGTRHDIRMDPADGLLRAGSAATQLTWMDARVDGRAVTPRHGKPVEINALWYNALMLTDRWASDLGRPANAWGEMAQQARRSFNQRFWYDQGGYLYDVVDQDGQNDPALRPNQILALSLTHPVLDEERWPAVLTAVERALLTPLGLRTLARDGPHYRGSYFGGPAQRDAAYHQGTVWPWLLGPFVDAWLRVRGDRQGARALLQAFPAHLLTAGLGAISEIADGDAPYTPRGCIAQAWSVGEVLRAWLATTSSSESDP